MYKLTKARLISFGLFYIWSMIKIGIQKSGRLNQNSIDLLKNCGISIENFNDQLKVSASNFPLDIL